MPEQIVYITESGGYGGAEKYLVHLCQDALTRYPRVSVALHFSASNQKLRAELQSLGIELTNIRYFKGLYPLNLLLALSFFRGSGNAFFHFSLPYITSCPLLLLAAALLRRPYLITEHLAPATPTAGGPYVRLHYLLFNTLKRKVYLRAKKVIAVSRQLKDILAGSYGMPEEKIAVIYNGVAAPAPRSPEPVLKQGLELPAGDVVITNVARLDDQKGQSYLLAALKTLVLEHPHLSVLLVGDGPNRAELLQQIQADGLEEQVKILGFRKDVPDILACSDIFVLPSLNEGFPFSIVEAMSAGVPVVVTNVGGNAEAVDEGSTGFVVASRDASGLAEALKILIEDRERRVRMGLNGKAKALSEFSLAGMLDKTFALYKMP